MDQQPPWSENLGTSHGTTVVASELQQDLQWENPHLVGDPRWQLARRVAASSSFARSSLLANFLLYVCDRALSGKTDEISEHQIGVHVFGRRPEYNPSEDNIVRSYARHLRQRLDHYFEAEGKQEELRLSIPRGKYVPHFEPNKVPDALPLDDEGTSERRPVAAPVRKDPPAAPVSRAQPPRFWRFGLSAIALVLLACGVLGWTFSRRTASVAADTSHVLWAQIFDKSRQTLLVPADDGLVMIQNLTKHSVNLAEYINRDYVSIKSPYNIDAQNMADLDEQRYTSMADLDTVLKFSRLPETTPGRFSVRYARELHMEDLKESNAILIGSSFSNPWVELFQKNLNFEFDYQPRPNESVIANRHPLQGELPVYRNDATAPSHRTYAVIALSRNLNDTGWVLIIEGLTMAGTQAAADILFSREAMLPVLTKAQTRNGELQPFELLIETRSFGSNAPQATIITSRIYSKPTS
jgi:succinate dehydrogenase hydrophobic anchor subunit